MKAKKRRDLQSLTSPIDGTITNLAAWTVGGVVKPGDTILNVVPLSATPEIEAMMLNKDVGFVRAGQRATVKFDAFPFTRYGTVDGEVIDVSRDANKDDKLGLIYPVRVRLDAATIDVDGKPVAITPGMAVSAEIITGDRRVIEYVLSPILRYRHEGTMRAVASSLRRHELGELSLQRHVVTHVEFLYSHSRQAGKNRDQVQLTLGFVGRDFLSGQHVGDDRPAKLERRDCLAIMLNWLAQGNLVGCSNHRKMLQIGSSLTTPIANMASETVQGYCNRLYSCAITLWRRTAITLRPARSRDD